MEKVSQMDKTKIDELCFIYHLLACQPYPFVTISGKDEVWIMAL